MDGAQLLPVASLSSSASRCNQSSTAVSHLRRKHSALSKGCHMDESNQSAESRRRSAATQNRTASASAPAVRTNEQSAKPTGAEAGNATRSSVEPTPHASSETGNGTDTGIVKRVRDRAGAQFATQKDMATDGIGTIARAVRRTTQELREQQHDTMADYVDRAADQLERLSSGLKKKDVGELFRDAQSLARRQPAMFVGSAFAIGLLGARFLKSSSPDRGYQQPAWQRVGRNEGGSQASPEYRQPQTAPYSQPAGSMSSAGVTPTPADARSSTTERGSGGASSRQRDGNTAAENL